MEALVVLTALPDAKAADRLARKTIREKRAACVSVIPAVFSHYRWKGKTERAREALVLIKTTRAAWPKLLRFLKENHPYEVPEILALPVTQGSKPYLAWLKSSVLVLCLTFAGPLLGADHLWAGEVFVKYSDVQDQIASPPKEEGFVTAEELLDLQKQDPSVLVFDARSLEQFRKEHIPGASLPMSKEHYRLEEMFRQKVVPTAPNRTVGLSQGVASFQKNTAIVTYCNRNCGLSKSLAKELTKMGFTNVRYLAGGIDSWREKGYPVEASK